LSAEERVYTINLGKALLSQPQHRAVRAVNMVREFASKHMRGSVVKIDEDLAHQIWERGARSPPRRIRVRIWVGDSDEIIVSKYEGEEASVETQKVPAAADAPNEPAPAAEAPEPEAGSLQAGSETAEPKEPETKAAPKPEPETPDKAEPASSGSETTEPEAPEPKPEPETPDGPSPAKDEPSKP